MLQNIEKSGELDKERSKEWLVNTDPGVRRNSLSDPYKAKHALKRLNISTLYFY